MIDYSIIEWDNIFYYDETSPSCLRWLIDSGKMRCCDVAGSKAWSNKEKTKPKCWDIRYNGKLYKAHRIIAMLKFKGLRNDLVINHIDNNPFNNRIDNLEIITQDENMRKCKSHTGRSLQVDNVTGFTGVSVLKRNGVPKYYTASHRCFPEGNQVNYNFSIVKYGNDLALALAKTCREYLIEENNKKGANYANLYE